MTDRHAAYLVVLDHDIREDDAQEGILTALRMLKGVVSVQPVLAGPEEAAAARRDMAWHIAVMDLLERMRQS